MPSFEYYYLTQAMGNFDIDNIGNFALSCTNNQYQEYLLMVNTVEGLTKIIQYGPQKIDDEKNEHISRTYSYFVMPFDQRKIENTVEKFVNDGKKCITQVTNISIEEALDSIVDIRELFNYDSTGTY